jgi:DNA-binding FadR family transcriptional regulator
VNETHHNSVTSAETSNLEIYGRRVKDSPHIRNEGLSMTQMQSRSSRLQVAAFAPIGDEGRTTLVELQLAQAISAGAFGDGERLPSEPELGRLMGVAVVTVREALVSLRHRGLIDTRRGRNGGSFVHSSLAAAEAYNARALATMPRVALADLGLHYEMITAACVEFACLRATPDELAVIREILVETRDLPRQDWRRRVTDVQLELAGLSQSVRLTQGHVRIQAEVTPLLALQDANESQRLATHDALVAQIDATGERDVNSARQILRESVRVSMRWLIAFRAQLLQATTDDELRATLKNRSRPAEASVVNGSPQPTGTQTGERS